MTTLHTHLRALGCLALIAVLLAFSAAPGSAGELSRAERFSLLFGSGNYEIETQFGRISISQIDGHTELSGEFQGITFSSENPSAQLYFESSELREEEGRKSLVFDGPGAMDVILVHDYNVDRMPAQERAFLESLMPGIFVEVDGHVQVPTAVLFVSEAGISFMAGFADHVPLQD